MSHKMTIEYDIDDLFSGLASLKIFNIINYKTMVQNHYCESEMHNEQCKTIYCIVYIQ